jgi:hypothetical protein
MFKFNKKIRGDINLIKNNVIKTMTEIKEKDLLEFSIYLKKTNINNQIKELIKDHYAFFVAKKDIKQKAKIKKKETEEPKITPQIYCEYLMDDSRCDRYNINCSEYLTCFFKKQKGK